MCRKQRETLQLILQRISVVASPTSSISIGMPSSISQPFLSNSYSELSSLQHNKRPIFSSQMLPSTKVYQEKRRSSTGGFTQPTDSIHYEPDTQWLKVSSSSRDKMTLSRDRLLPEVPEEGSQSSFVDQHVPVRRLSQQDDHGPLQSGRYSLSQPNFETRSLSPAKLYKGDSNGRKFSTNSSLGSPSEEELEGSGLYNLAMQSITSSKLYPGPTPMSHQSHNSKVSVTSTDSAYITDQLETDISPHSSYDFREKSPHMDTAQQHIFPTPPGASNNLTEDEILIEWEV